VILKVKFGFLPEADCYFISARVIAPSDADETSAAYLWKTPEA
jgi:hypothetical protein